MTHPVCKNKYTIDGTFVGIEYNRLAKKLIYKFKYKPYLSDLSRFLSSLLYESLIQKEEFAALFERYSPNPPNREAGFFFVPVPLFSAKERSRGYNQSELLASGLAGLFGVGFDKSLLRIKNTKTQAGLTKTARRTNLENTFIIRKESKAISSSSYVFLVDDILTTGATFASAASVLKRAGVEKVFGIALAKEK